uniref:Amidohydrolase n=1 Tax=Thermosporothrix sp. COM3 TaxID=2490863 RepID=A0A455SVG8_9CHLR|nr:amidohydrolase [Thermosporothrix sp. COM3]
MQQTILYNATLVLPDRVLHDGWLLLEDTIIADLGTGQPPIGQNGYQYIDIQGDLVMPGLIDLHCDAIEKLVEPRPRVLFDIPTALHEADYRLACSGITTEFHAISLDDQEFGVRSDSFARDFARILQETREHTLIRHKLHARIELSSAQASTIVEQMLNDQLVDLVSLMDHSPGQGQYRTEEEFRFYIARTSHRSPTEIDELIVHKREQAKLIPQRIEQITALARHAKVSLATHDDDTATRVEAWPALGVSISEFPTTEEAARRAQELGLTVCMGAPNVVRGKSSGGNLSATEATRKGYVDALCADYHPASMLGAVFTLAQKEILSLPEAVNMVTRNPARAIGQTRLGTLEQGNIADLIQVRHSPYGVPRVQRVFIDGKLRIQSTL